MSNIANMGVMLGGFSRQNLENNTEDGDTELDHESHRPKEKVIQKSKECRSLLKTNNRENSEITINTERLNKLRNYESKFWEIE